MHDAADPGCCHHSSTRYCLVHSVATVTRSLAVCAGHALLQCCKLIDQQNAAAAAAAISANGKQQQGQQQQPVPTAASPAVYEAVAGRAFGRLGQAVVSGIMYAELLGICCVYVVLEVS